MEEFRDIMPVYRDGQILGVYIEGYNGFSKEEMEKVRESFSEGFRLGTGSSKGLVVLSEGAEIADLIVEMNDEICGVNLVMDSGRKLHEVLNEVRHLAYMAISTRREPNSNQERFYEVPINPDVDEILEKYA